MRIVLTTVPAEACERIARALVEERLAACVNAFPVTSTYRWKGEVEVAQEQSLFIKVSAAGVARLRERLRALHPYELPEIVVLDVDVEASLPEYVAWVRGECEESGPDLRIGRASPKGTDSGESAR